MSRFVHVRLWIVCGLLMTGCDPGVREDRSATYSTDGQRVSFQHGSRGVYVAGPDGTGLKKIFQPEPDVTATSRPLSSPVDGQLIFVTAVPLDPAQASQVDHRPSPAEGRFYASVPVRYTCWIRRPPAAEGIEQADPEQVDELFQATCGHAGYVGAGLAVRWSPDGKRIYFLDLDPVAPDRHVIQELDLQTGRTRRAFPHSFADGIFDWSPRGVWLCVVLHDRQATDDPARIDRTTSGIWLGHPDQEQSWWHVPGTDELAPVEGGSDIERLRATRPQWSEWDGAIVYASGLDSHESTISDGGMQGVQTLIWQVDLADREPVILERIPGWVNDLASTPDGKWIGFRNRFGDASERLYLGGRQQPFRTLDISGSSLLEFCGFDATGRRLAYVAADTTDLPPVGQRWSLLLLNDLRARSHLVVADVETPAIADKLLSGGNLTFARWAPRGDQLSLWVTFSPRYRSLFSVIAGLGLRDGDPAATVNVSDRTLNWMTVSTDEELQVAHYMLQQGHLGDARTRYDQCRTTTGEPQAPADWSEFQTRLSDGYAAGELSLYSSICWRRMGDFGASDARRAEFEQTFFPVAALSDGVPASGPVGQLSDLLSDSAHSEFFRQLVRNLYLAEVLLSVDDLTVAMDELAPGQSGDVESGNESALADAVVFAQLLLIAGRHDEYSQLATESLATGFATLITPPETPPVSAAKSPKLDATEPVRQPDGTADRAPDRQDTEDLLTSIAGITLAPLFHPRFHAQLPPERRIWLREQWNLRFDRAQANDEKVAAGLVLHALAQQAGDSVEAELWAGRVISLPIGKTIFDGKPIEKTVDSWFQINTDQNWQSGRR